MPRTPMLMAASIPQSAHIISCIAAVETIAIEMTMSGQFLTPALLLITPFVLRTSRWSNPYLLSSFSPKPANQFSALVSISGKVGI
jgi:hypothetical protein